eukprot:scaffold18180_cov128-Isochrysis_galbana.AAC.1
MQTPAAVQKMAQHSRREQPVNLNAGRPGGSRPGQPLFRHSGVWPDRSSQPSGTSWRPNSQ